jgi:uncharacterized protein YneF (UPF0154 family)
MKSMQHIPTLIIAIAIAIGIIGIGFIAVNYLSHKLEEAIDDEDDNAFF